MNCINLPEFRVIKADAQTLIDKNTDLFTVQQLLGHQNLTTTQKYHLPKIEVKEEAVENLYTSTAPTYQP